LPEEQGEIDLRQMLMIFVFAIANLPETFRITGDGRAVIGQIFFVHPALPLKAEKSLLGFLSDGCE